MSSPRRSWATAVLLLMLSSPVLAGCQGGGGGTGPEAGDRADPHGATTSEKLPEWEPVETLYTPRDDFGTAVVGSEIWVLGGMTGARGNRLTSIEVLDTTTGRWRTAGAEMPVGLASFETVAIGPRIYSFGGFDSEFRASELSAYLDTRTGRWHRLPPLPHPRYAHTVTRHEGKVYVVGGRDADGAVAEIDVFDPATETWHTAAARMPGARDSHDTVSTPRGLLVIGGFTADGPTDRVDLFDPATGAEHPVPALPAPANRGGAAVVDGRVWYSWHEKSWVLDLDGAPAWQPANAMTKSRHGLGYVAVGGFLYGIAGCTESPLRDVRTVDRMPLP